MSKYVLRFLAKTPELPPRITFVRSREFLTNTMLISELGSPRIGFELELGARQREEVSIVNGRLVRHVRRDRSLCVNEPSKAVELLKDFKERLYVVFSFSGPVPSWYERIVEPHPALPVRSGARESIETVFEQILQEQVDLALIVIRLKNEIDDVLKRKDRRAFKQIVPLYKEITRRCLWDF